MNAIGSALAKLASPKFYVQTYTNYMMHYSKKYVQTNSGAPLIHGMLFIGGFGYTVGWFTKEKYHIAHKNEALAKGMAMMGDHH
mmetsp:Transcript_42304/g.132580  ORF Transcript_42304/g.132580 Transcript_42304/m.132580 type:complete len:84 (+) Transcript_42304:191-442(+)